MRYILYFSIFAILFSGCSSKRYYEPLEVGSKVEMDGRLNSKIVDVKRDGATLENGHFISRDGVVDIALPKEFRFINSSENYYFASSSCGKLIIIPKDRDQEIIEKVYDFSVISVAESRGKVALLLSDNSTKIFDLKDQNVIFEKKQNTTYAHTNITANPYFLNDLVLIPTLDGKIVVYDLNSNKNIRDIVVDDSGYFNNIIFLDVLEDRLVAATSSKIISVSPNIINTFDANIREIIFVRDRIYIFTKDGRIVLSDLDLNQVGVMKFPFAHFVGALHGEYIYAVEKSGYILGVDIDLTSFSVFEFASSNDENIFTSAKRVYFDDKYFELNNMRNKK